MFNLFKSQKKAPVKEQKKADTSEWDFDVAVAKFPQNQYVKSRMEKLIINDNKFTLTPQAILKRKQDRINVYYELKEYCYKQGKVGETWFRQTYQECFNSQRGRFDFIDALQQDLSTFQNNYDKYIKEYEQRSTALKTANHDVEDEQPQDRLSVQHLNVSERANIYMNSNNDYISPSGKKCVEFEESLLEYAELYKQGLCPYCKELVTMPKIKTSCPYCNNKIHVVKGGIKQGNMALKDDDYNKLKSLRDDFYTERQYNSNYDLKVDIKNTYYNK